jgi:hypothetical protein
VLVHCGWQMIPLYSLMPVRKHLWYLTKYKNWLEILNIQKNNENTNQRKIKSHTCDSWFFLGIFLMQPKWPSMTITPRKI